MIRPVRLELMPGVWLTSIENRAFRSSRWSLHLLAPLRRETAALNALLPRILLCGTAREPSPVRLGGALERLDGGEVTPSVCQAGDAHAVGFHAAFLRDGLSLDGAPILRRSAELMGDLFLRPATRNGRLRGDALERARTGLLSALREEAADPVRALERRLIREMCAREPFGLHPLGEEKRIAAVRAGKINSHYRALRASCPLELVYCGPAGADEVARAWGEALMDLPRTVRAAVPETARGVRPAKLRALSGRTGEPVSRLALGFRTQIAPEQAEESALLLLTALWETAALSGWGAEGPCRALRPTLHRDKGLLTLTCRAEGGALEQAQASILAALDALRAGVCGEKALETARRTLLHRLRCMEDSPDALLRYYTPSPRRLSPAELADLVRETGRAELARAAQLLEPDTVLALAGQDCEEV